MASSDPIPEADRQEQDTPAPHDPRAVAPHAPDVPDADALEQEAAVTEIEVPAGIDAEREEPVSDEGWGATTTGSET